MKKLFLSLVAAFVCTASLFAQSTLVATLEHNGTLSNYYGENALATAHEAAVNGDVITLSSGQFTSSGYLTITKAITIRGAGIQNNESMQNPTVWANVDILFRPTSGDENCHLIVEGIQFNSGISIQTSADVITEFRKCFMDNLGQMNSNTRFIDCKIQNVRLRGAVNNGSAYFTNCIINKGGMNWQDGILPTTIQNSILLCAFPGATYIKWYLTTISNSIIFNPAYFIGRNEDATNYCSVSNCVMAQSDNVVNIDAGNCTQIADIYSIFKTWRGYTYLTEFINGNFELTDAAKTTYLGSDGTQVGIYGGAVPYSERVNAPRITTFNTASQVQNGTINVRVVVE